MHRFIINTDLHKIGGFDLFPTLLQDNEEDVRASACSLIGTVVQNNLQCQTEALNLGLLSQLLELLDKDDKMAVKVKALYAVSCKYIIVCFSILFVLVFKNHVLCSTVYFLN